MGFPLRKKTMTKQFFSARFVIAMVAATIAGSGIIILTLSVPPSIPSLAIESSRDLYLRVSEIAQSRCDKYNANLFIARPEIILDESTTAKSLNGSAFLSLRGGGHPGDPCGVHEQRFEYNIYDKTWIIADQDFAVDLGEVNACHWQDTRITSGEGDHIAISSLMVESIEGSCTPGKQRFRFLKAGSQAGNIQTETMLDLDPKETTVRCGSTPRTPLLWFVDDAATAIVNDNSYVVTACGNPGISEAPRTFQIFRVDVAGNAITLTIDGSPGSTTGLAIPKWPNLSQSSLVATGVDSQAVLIYTGDPQNGLGPYLAWAILDLNPVTCPAGCLADRGGWLGGGPQGDVERDPLGAAILNGNLAVAYLKVSSPELYTECSNGDLQCLPFDAGALSIRVLPLAALNGPEIAEIDVEGVDVPSTIDPSLLTAATHPDLARSGDRLILVYALSHYPKDGCGIDRTKPCRWQSPNLKPDENNIKLITSKASVILTVNM